MAFDDDPATRWGAGPGTRSGWLAVDLGEVKRIGRLWVNEATWDRIRRFELQIQKDGRWRTIHSGTTIGADFTARFEPVSARHVRLNILEATDVPTIWEVHLFEE
jgi:alpha-L-fucosidase